MGQPEGNPCGTPRTARWAPPGSRGQKAGVGQTGSHQPSQSTADAHAPVSSVGAFAFHFALGAVCRGRACPRTRASDALQDELEGLAVLPRTDRLAHLWVLESGRRGLGQGHAQVEQIHTARAPRGTVNRRSLG